MTHTLCQVLPTIAAATVSALFAASAAGQPRLPRLRYEPPADLMHSALGPPENYESTRISASLQVYAFRAAGGDVSARFQQTLLREWIAPQFQEAQLLSPPALGTMSVPGAETAYYAQFAEPSYAGARPRLRVLIVARGAAAIVDAQAATPQAWQVAQASFNALIGTLRVDEGGATAGPVTPASRALAGLYVGTKPKFVSAIGPGIGAGSGGFVQAVHLYLFSEDGRVYRAYDDIRTPGGDIRRFDFDAAEQADPVNSGHYVVQGGRLTLTMGERGEETITVPLRQDGRLTIETVEYTRQR
jgi:hypothetical protein